MQMNLQSTLITKDLEKRLEKDIFSLEIEGYNFFSIDEEIEIKKQLGKESFGKAIVSEISWKSGCTYLTYRLLSLKTVN